MSKTYTRVFGNAGKVNPFGHAYINALNVKSVKKANLEIKEMLEKGK